MSEIEDRRTEALAARRGLAGSQSRASKGWTRSRPRPRRFRYRSERHPGQALASAPPWHRRSAIGRDPGPPTAGRSTLSRDALCRQGGRQRVAPPRRGRTPRLPRLPEGRQADRPRMPCLAAGIQSKLRCRPEPSHFAVSRTQPSRDVVDLHRASELPELIDGVVRQVEAQRPLNGFGLRCAGQACHERGKESVIQIEGRSHGASMPYGLAHRLGGLTLSQYKTTFDGPR